VKGVICAAPGRIFRVALGRRLARADTAAGVPTLPDPRAAMPGANDGCVNATPVLRR
jgi:hypothetical protein